MLRLPDAVALHALDRVGSTNNEALRLAQEGAPDFTLVWAKEQEAGRGRRGRTWQSPQGNLYTSMVLRPALPPAQAALGGFAAALAVAEAVEQLVPGLAAQVKWPNDVLVDGAKIGGILLESAGIEAGIMTGLVVGVGINLASAPKATPYPATFLSAKGQPVFAEDALQAYVWAMVSWVAGWRQMGFAPIRQAWLSRARGLGQNIRLQTETGAAEGIFQGLDEDGALLLADGRRFLAGDVFFS
jgi:BirA family biotin operon repressor/biotin-[acetyl-CoA-carboxylase] ligase